MKAVKAALLIAGLSSLLFSCKDDDAPVPASPLSGVYTFKQAKTTGHIVVITDTGVSDSVITNYNYTVTGSGELEFDAKNIYQKDIAYKYAAQTEYITYFKGEITNKSETSSDQEVDSFSKKIEYLTKEDSIHFSEPLLDNEKDVIGFPLKATYFYLDGAAVLLISSKTETRDTTTNSDGTPRISISTESQMITLEKKLN